MSLISKLILTNFRNFSYRKIELDSPITLFTGINGVGKTNVLEAVTLIDQTASLRKCNLEEMILRDRSPDISSQKNSQQFTVYAEISNCEFIEKIAVSFDAKQKKKSFYINGELFNNKRQGDLQNKIPRFIYLTPQLEQVFILGKSERRDYLDKIVSDIDYAHNKRINDYQKLLKERLIILQKYRSQKTSEKWLSVIENNIVELGTAIASARIEAVEFFNKAIASFSSNFPKPELLVTGDVEQYVMKQSAVQLEEFYKNKLVENREIDSENFKTNFGVHRSDFDAIFTSKNTSAIYSSTGEQKSIMLGITLARAKISSQYKNQTTAMVFDEVMSHLDDKRKSDLFDEIQMTGLQTFCSATSLDLVPSGTRNKIHLIDI